jgi:hypothetical protein
LPFPLDPLRSILSLRWARTQEFTADRAGLIACRQTSKAVAAQVKLVVGRGLFDHVDIDLLARQAADLHSGWMHFGGMLAEAQANHPLILNRIVAILRFSESQIAAPPPAALQRPAQVATFAVRQGDQAGRVFLVDGPSTSCRRGGDNDIRIADQGASRRQFQLFRATDGFWIEDLQSSNGTRVNSSRVSCALLRDGDMIGLGDTVLEFRGNA